MRKGAFTSRTRTRTRSDLCIGARLCRRVPPQHLFARRTARRSSHRFLRHAESAIAYGQDDASALAFAGFVIGMDKHDRAAALTAFEAALSVSPSSALTYILGSVIFAFAGEAERV